MARSTKTQKALNVNAAHGLLSRGVSVTEAATILARERGLSLRQAYRYVERARTIRRALPVETVSTGDIQNSPRRACTIAPPIGRQRFVLKRNCHPRSEEVLDLDAATPPTYFRRSAGPPAICLEFAFDRLLPMKLQQVYGLLVADCVA